MNNQNYNKMNILNAYFVKLIIITNIFMTKNTIIYA